MMNENQLWQAVCERDATQDGTFFFAVRTTGIYCKPSCAARRPKRENVAFFATQDEAEAAGYRPCQRCHPRTEVLPEPNLALMEQVCRMIESSEEELSLNQLADHFALSPYHLQRTFKRIIGVSPKQYAAAHRTKRLKHELKQGSSVTTATYNAGFESNSTLAGQTNHLLGMTPSIYQKSGQATEIQYTIRPCPLGWLLAARTERGLCAVRLGDSPESLETTLRNEFNAAILQPQEEGLASWVDRIVDYLHGHQPHLDLPVDVRATAFQQRVWKELQSIPYGETRSYGQVAQSIEQPRAVRAVARACASNSVALVVPCHRVVRGDGDLGGYRWGVDRKQKLLEMEHQTR
ncbi:MAG: bifunctional DNA-binding transcriptional regulator/O6-methylguanine-DNA methyltransferase Ada [Caldilineaceae bacterium]